MGGFHPGESWLIPFSFTVTALFYARREQIRAAAMHALWHLVGPFGFVALWAFNHVRFAPPAPGAGGAPGGRAAAGLRS